MPFPIKTPLTGTERLALYDENLGNRHVTVQGIANYVNAAAGDNLATAALTATGTYVQNWATFPIDITNLGFLRLVSGTSSFYFNTSGATFDHTLNGGTYTIKMLGSDTTFYNEWISPADGTFRVGRSSTKWGLFNDTAEVSLRDDQSVRLASNTSDYRFAYGDSADVYIPTQDDLQTRILAVAADTGRIYWRDASTISGAVSNLATDNLIQDIEPRTYNASGENLTFSNIDALTLSGTSYASTFGIYTNTVNTSWTQTAGTYVFNQSSTSLNWSQGGSNYLTLKTGLSSTALHIETAPTINNGVTQFIVRDPLTGELFLNTQGAATQSQNLFNQNGLELQGDYTHNLSLAGVPKNFTLQGGAAFNIGAATINLQASTELILDSPVYKLNTIPGADDTVGSVLGFDTLTNQIVLKDENSFPNDNENIANTDLTWNRALSTQDGGTNDLTFTNFGTFTLSATTLTTSGAQTHTGALSMTGNLTVTGDISVDGTNAQIDASSGTYTLGDGAGANLPPVGLGTENYLGIDTADGSLVRFPLGADTNLANTNLTLTGNRVHFLSTNSLKLGKIDELGENIELSLTPGATPAYNLELRNAGSTVDIVKMAASLAGGFSHTAQTSSTVKALISGHPTSGVVVQHQTAASTISGLYLTGNTFRLYSENGTYVMGDGSGNDLATERTESDYGFLAVNPDDGRIYRRDPLVAHCALNGSQVITNVDDYIDFNQNWSNDEDVSGNARLRPGTTGVTFEDGFTYTVKVTAIIQFQSNLAGTVHEFRITNPGNTSAWRGAIFYTPQVNDRSQTVTFTKTGTWNPGVGDKTMGLYFNNSGSQTITVEYASLDVQLISID